MTAEKDVQVARKKTFFFTWGVPLEVTDTRWPPCHLQNSSASVQFLLSLFLLQRKHWPPNFSQASKPRSRSSPGHPATHLLSPHPPSSELAVFWSSPLEASRKRQIMTLVFLGVLFLKTDLDMCLLHRVVPAQYHYCQHNSLVCCSFSFSFASLHHRSESTSSRRPISSILVTVILLQLCFSSVIKSEYSFRRVQNCTWKLIWNQHKISSAPICLTEENSFDDNITSDIS